MNNFICKVQCFPPWALIQISITGFGSSPGLNVQHSQVLTLILLFCNFNIEYSQVLPMFRATNKVSE